MILPKELTTVTPASKLLAMILFLSLPIVGFLLGMRHEQLISSPSITISYPTPTSDETANWKTYSDELFTFRYPEDWIVGPVQIFGLRSEVEFSYQKSPVFTLAKIANYNNGTQKPFTTLEEFIGTIDSNAKEVLLADQKAKYIAHSGVEGHVTPYKEVVSFSPDRSFLLVFTYQQAYIEDYYEKSGADKILDQILSTFQFTK